MEFEHQRKQNPKNSVKIYKASTKKLNLVLAFFVRLNSCY